MQELNDREVAVVIDSLAAMRDRFHEMKAPAPTVESALAKITSLVTPSTVGLKLEVVE